MSEPTPAARPSESSWRWVNLVLMALAVLLVAASVVFFVRAAQASDKQSADQTLTSRDEAIKKAAKDETLAFLTVDYRNMDPLIDKVLAGATGGFKTQYAGARSQLKSSTQQAQAVSTGKVISVGLSDVTDKTASVFIAADSSVTNKSTKGKAEPRYYRLKMTMVRTGDTWRTSDLQFVG